MTPGVGRLRGASSSCSAGPVPGLERLETRNLLSGLLVGGAGPGAAPDGPGFRRGYGGGAVQFSAYNARMRGRRAGGRRGHRRQRGELDIVTAPGPGRPAAHQRLSGQRRNSNWPVRGARTWSRGGIWVASGDVNGDGQSEIVVSPGWVADVAALEWAYEEAQLAADGDALSPDAFAAVAPEDYERLTFAFHPACRFVQSRYPIVKIWRVNQPETLSDEVIDLDSGGDNVLVLRTPECVEFHRLPAARFALFEALARGEPLGMALERAQAVEIAQRTERVDRVESDFDLGAALRDLMELQVLTTLST